MERIVDAHVHVWGHTVASADWLAGAGNDGLRRVFEPRDLSIDVAGSGVDSVVCVTAEESAIETARLLRLADTEELIAAVVGWVDPFGGDPAGALEVMRGSIGGEWLAGIRFSVFAEPAEWLADAQVAKAVAAIAHAGLACELLIDARQLTQVASLADRLPDATFVVDHLGNPPRGEVAGYWADGLTQIARYPNVAVKLSGVALADRSGAQADQLLNALGPGRVMYGSDWPVSTRGVGYGDILCAAKEMVLRLSADERQFVLRRTASRVYGLAE